MDDFERDKTDAYFSRGGILNMKVERNDHMLHYEQMFVNVSKKCESKCCGVLMNHRLKVKSEQLIVLQMTQHLQTKNINFVPEKQFCRRCIARFLLEIDSLS